MSTGSLITAGSIWNEFKNRYIAGANSGVSWYNNLAPVVYVRRVNPSLYPEKVFPDNILYQGGSSYRPDPYPGTMMSDTFRGELIGAQSIINFLRDEARLYTRIRYLSATFTVTGTGGNTGTHLPDSYSATRTEFTHYNSTQKAILASDQSGSYASITYSSPMTSGRTIYWSDITGLVTSLITSYNNVIWNPLSQYNTRICHASCHSSCHGSRGRR